MIAVVQRVKNATVEINGSFFSGISSGFLVFVGIIHSDTDDDAKWLAKKIIHMRIFSDENGKMNLSLKEARGEVLVVSQFTLCANIVKGNRPSFTDAARPEIAIPLYKNFIQYCELESGMNISQGMFGADMKITLTNEGPVTIIIDSKNR